MKLPKPIAVVSPNKPIHGDVIWFKNLTAADISKLMGNADFGVFPASTVAIEACARRLPFICGYFVKNQKDIYNGINKNNLAICVGDFNGIKSDGFDGRGNYNLGITEQIIFPEINIDKVNRISGMDITFVTTADTDKEAKALLTELGLPFKKN